jgi:hypothetical protein
LNDCARNSTSWAIEEHDSDNFEGVLVTDTNKHSGSI